MSEGNVLRHVCLSFGLCLSIYKRVSTEREQSFNLMAVSVKCEPISIIIGRLVLE